MRRLISLFPVIFALGGCAVPPPPGPPPALEPAAICTMPDQCEAMWAEALVQVQNISGMKLQIATESFAQTYNSTGAGRLSATIRKVPRPEGGKTIEAEFSCVYCGNLPYSAANLFTANVKAVGDKFSK